MTADLGAGDTLILCPRCAKGGARTLLDASGKTVTCMVCSETYGCQDLIEADLRAQRITRAPKPVPVLETIR